MRHLIFSTLLLVCSSIACAQQQFSVDLEEISIPGFTPVHSGAYAQLDGKWIFIGGRINGLHGFHTSDGFLAYGIHDLIQVIDPVTQETWAYNVDSLSDGIREAITSSNMQYYQDGNTLYMAGGYGWNDTADEFRTFPTLTAVDLPGLITAVMDSTDVTSYFRQTVNDTLAITGAHLQKLGNTFYLVFGHRFDGTYSENHTAGFFVQTYSNAVRTFSINDNGTNLSVSGFDEEVDTNNFHRRDYNLVPQIFPDGQEGFTAFSGVFQKGINIPYFTTIDINGNGNTHIPGFNQNLSQYHNAVVPLYDSLGNIMHSLFFGGMSMYRLDTVNDELITDSLVPFISSISKVSRTGDSTLTEYLLPDSLPARVGSNAYFIPLPYIDAYDNGVIKLNSITGHILIGHIVGGIESPEANISGTDPTLSFACPRIFEVSIETVPDAIEETQVKEPAGMKVYPNPAGDEVSIDIEATGKQDLDIILLNSHGQVVEHYFSDPSFSGKEKITKNISALRSGLYYILLQTSKFSRVQRLIVK